jgi:hypothetical protein
LAVRRAYKLRAFPTRPQEGRVVRLLADHCDLYNAALQERREAWRMRNLSITYSDQSAQLKEIRAADPDGRAATRSPRDGRTAGWGEGREPPAADGRLPTLQAAPAL